MPESSVYLGMAWLVPFRQGSTWAICRWLKPQLSMGMPRNPGLSVLMWLALHGEISEASQNGVLGHADLCETEKKQGKQWKSVGLEVRCHSVEAHWDPDPTWRVSINFIDNRGI